MSVSSTTAAGRAAAERRMTSTCTIKRPTGNKTTDAAGYEVPEWATVQADLRCRFAQPPRGSAASRSVTRGGVEVELTTPELHVPVATAGIRDEDVGRMDSGEDAGAFFRVVNVPGKSDKTALRLKIIEMQEPKGWSA